MRPLSSLLAVALMATAGAAFAQPMPQIGGQASHIEALDFMKGEWRGTATIYSQTGPQTLTQTERVGTMLQGDILVVEGHGYDADGETEFNAMGIVSWNPATAAYDFRSYAMGFSGTYPFNATENGFAWEIPAGPNAKIVYNAVIEGDDWHETGHYVRDGMAPVKTIEMTLKRIGDTDWPAANPVSLD
ncbi:hypothetical protein [Parvularcula sp. LCG005]|uniref:hypothetical protein n=1 Tax=Parvularcula sp. LCG005 TaxID=3078805 RepID=UPI002943093F|nr:hypothetical protein [Parvularcula sp. LCG005]WOI52369.1 hypothetical protein RUI03_09415 [Parvularcula sp. LCG005]